MKFKPTDCHFGLTINYESFISDASNVGILLSVPQENDTFARDDVDEDMIEGFPAWLRNRSDAEAFYLGPDGWDEHRVKLELEKLGFAHNPKWDNDYGA